MTNVVLCLVLWSCIRLTSLTIEVVWSFERVLVAVEAAYLSLIHGSRLVVASERLAKRRRQVCSIVLILAPICHLACISVIFLRRERRSWSRQRVVSNRRSSTLYGLEIHGKVGPILGSRVLSLCTEVHV